MGEQILEQPLLETDFHPTVGRMRCGGSAISIREDGGVVPLPQRVAEFSPGIGVGMFHVKQTPVEESTPFLRRPLDQCEAVRVDDVDRRPLYQFRAPLDRLSIDVDIEFPRAARKARLEIRKTRK